MNTVLNNKKGYAALIGLLVVVLLVAVLIYGGSFFSENDDSPEGTIEKSLDAKKQAEEKIDEINVLTEERAELIGDTISNPKSIGTLDLEINIEDDSILESPLKIEGSVGEGVKELTIELRDEAGNTKVSESLVTKTGTEGKNTFSITIYYEFSSTKAGNLLIIDANKKDRFVEIPVRYSDEEKEK